MEETFTLQDLTINDDTITITISDIDNDPQDMEEITLNF